MYLAQQTDSCAVSQDFLHGNRHLRVAAVSMKIAMYAKYEVAGRFTPADSTFC
jgi:hypothetical protein